MRSIAIRPRDINHKKIQGMIVEFKASLGEDSWLWVICWNIGEKIGISEWSPIVVIGWSEGHNKGRLYIGSVNDKSWFEYFKRWDFVLSEDYQPIKSAEDIFESTGNEE